MRVRSLFQHRNEIQTLDLELRLVPGLPQIHFIGLPDRALKESAIRIKAAIRAQGFKFPIAQRVLVHLKPSHIPKKSCGLDLAVAAALLWETEQIPPPADTEPVLYGELSLSGEIERPPDLASFVSKKVVWTGAGGPTRTPVREFKALAQLAWSSPIVPSLEIHPSRPAYPVASFDDATAEVAMAIAAGEHSALISGPPGAGKSTLAESIPSWLEAPRDLNRQSWRPVSRPHHSSSSFAMIGGGTQLWAGEVAKVDEGVLIMDELLEFKGDVQEALREPMDSGSISISRAGRTRTFPARVLVLATTNLCPCGRFLPGPQRQSRCTCRALDRRRSLARLTGPFADRFPILYYFDSQSLSSKQVSSVEIAQCVEAAIQFRRSRKQSGPNARLDPDEIFEGLSAFQKSGLASDLAFASRRRRAAVLQVARTFADLEASTEIRDRHLDRSLELCVRNHRMLEQSND